MTDYLCWLLEEYEDEDEWDEDDFGEDGEEISAWDAEGAAKEFLESYDQNGDAPSSGEERVVVVRERHREDLGPVVYVNVLVEYEPTYSSSVHKRAACVSCGKLWLAYEDRLLRPCPDCEQKEREERYKAHQRVASRYMRLPLAQAEEKAKADGFENVATTHVFSGEAPLPRSGEVTWLKLTLNRDNVVSAVQVSDKLPAALNQPQAEAKPALGTKEEVPR